MKINVIILVLLFLFVIGCMSKEEYDMEKILVLAEGFKDGGMIPVDNTCDGKDKSPAISLKGIPEGTKSIVLIMDDPDAPGGTFTHWVLYNIPPDTELLSGGIPRKKTLSDESMQGMNDFGDSGYGGPCPPRGNPHRYYFKVYALDTMLNIPAGASKTEIENAMKNHILENGVLMGKYKR